MDFETPNGSARALPEALIPDDTSLGLLVDAVKDYAIFTLDPSGLVLTWNEGARRIKGYQASEIIGRHFSLFYTAEDIAQNKPSRLLSLALSQGRVEDEGVRVRKDGTRFQADIVLTPIFDRQGLHRGFAKVTRDITERKEAEKRLIDAKQIADRANEAKTVFLATMSHELRTPLNAVIGFSDFMLADQPGDLERWRSYLEYIHTAGQQLLALVNDTLDMAAIESGRLHLSDTLFALKDGVASIVGLIEAQATSRGVTITTDVPDGVHLWADPGRFKQTLLNLLSNAVKFTPAGGEVCVRISEDSEHVMVAVSDTGVGIKPEDQERIFEPFERASQPASEGTGLGLAIVRRIVEAEGGTVSVRSVPDQGSEFLCRFPRPTVGHWPQP